MPNRRPNETTTQIQFFRARKGAQMTKQRRARTDSTEGLAKAVKGAGAMIEVPAHIELDSLGLIFWTEIIAMRDVSEWTPHDLSYAGMLAKTMSLADDERTKLFDEGAILNTDKGTKYANPRATVLHGLESRIKSMRQSLNIHGRARQGEARDQAGRAAKNRQSASEAQEAMSGSDGLLAN